MKTLTNILVALVLVFSYSFGMTSCGGHDDPQPTPQNPNAPITGILFNPVNCKGLSVKDYFGIGNKWTRTMADTTIHYTIPTVYTILSDSTFSEAYSNGYIYLYRLHTYKVLDCLKFTSAEGMTIHSTSLKTFIKFIDKNKVYLISEGTDTSKVDFSKQDFYKRTN